MLKSHSPMHGELYISPIFKGGRCTQLCVDLVSIMVDVYRLWAAIGIVGSHKIGRLAGIGGNERRRRRLIGWGCDRQMYVLSGNGRCSHIACTAVIWPRESGSSDGHERFRT